MPLRWRMGLALALVVGASVGASLLAVDAATERADRTATRKLEGFAVQLFAASRKQAIAGCKRNTADRRTHIKRSQSSMVANTVVALDPGQPAITREARARQARVDRRAIREYQDRIVNCRQAYPPVDPDVVRARVAP